MMSTLTSSPDERMSESENEDPYVERRVTNHGLMTDVLRWSVKRINGKRDLSKPLILKSILQFFTFTLQFIISMLFFPEFNHPWWSRPKITLAEPNAPKHTTLLRACVQTPLSPQDEFKLICMRAD